MNAAPSLKATLNLRQLLVLAVVVGGALATPFSLFGQAAMDASGNAVEATELLQGWILKSIEPQADLTAEFLSQAGRAMADGWLPFKAMPAIRAFRKEHLLFATISDKSGRVLARANAFADLERQLTFPEAKLAVRVQDGALAITTDKSARAVHLEGDASGDAFGWFFEDNYFDLLPGEEKVVGILGDHRSGRISAKAWYSPHITTVDWQRALPAGVNR